MQLHNFPVALKMEKVTNSIGTTLSSVSIVDRFSVVLMLPIVRVRVYLAVGGVVWLKRRLKLALALIFDVEISFVYEKVIKVYARCWYL